MPHFSSYEIFYFCVIDAYVFVCEQHSLADGQKTEYMWRYRYRIAFSSFCSFQYFVKFSFLMYDFEIDIWKVYIYEKCVENSYCFG